MNIVGVPGLAVALSGELFQVVLPNDSIYSAQ